MKTFLPRIFSLLSLGATITVSAQTYTGGGGAIPDLTTTNFPLTVSGLSPSTLDTGVFGFETIKINLTHTYDGDLDIQLIAPDGTSATLASGLGGGGQNYTNTIFDENAATPIISGSAPFTGTFSPQSPMGQINNGQNGNGTWTLRITDMYGADSGNLISWQITFGNNPASQGVFFTSSNLPIVVINTNNQNIVDDPKIGVDFGIIYNGVGVRNHLSDPWNHYNGRAGIETRGSSSQMFPKKPYGIELWDINGNAIDSSLLGMPKESDWMLNPGYSDKTLMHNELAYDLSSQMGHYAARWQMVEVIINGQYMGVYALMEKIKRDGNRVDISKLQNTDITGDQLTGGYIVKVDKTTGNGGGGWNSAYLTPQGTNIYFQYEYPSDVNIVPQQQQYIQAYVDSFETALYNNNFDTVTGYRRYFGLNTAVDYFLIDELSRNVDGYRLSTYLHKDRYSKGGKLKMGPVWDFDIAFHNANYCDGWRTDGWAYQFGNVCPGDYWEIPFWWDHLMQDTNFTNRLRCRWDELKQTIFSPTYLDYWIDSMATYLNESQQRNYQQWPIIGQYVWPNVSPIPQSYQAEVDTLKSWLHRRVSWLDANMPGSLNGCNLTSVKSDDAIRPALIAYPNPAHDRVQLLFDLTETAEVTVSVMNLTGQEALAAQRFRHTPGPQTIPLDLSSLPAGMYFVQVRFGDTVLQQRVLKSE